MSCEVEVSLVLAVFNGEDYLEESLDSILSQSYQSLEVIIVNDGSTDKSSEILRKTKYEDFLVIERGNKGLTKSLIEACDKAKGRWIARLDCGDLALPERIEKQVEYMKNHNVIACFSHALKISLDGKKLHEQKSILNEQEPKLQNFLFDNPLIHSTAMFSREHYIRCGGYQPNFKVSQDFDLWTRLIKLGKIEVLDDVLVHSREDLCGISFKNKEDQAKAAALVSHRVSEELWKNFSSTTNFWEAMHRIRLNCWPYVSNRNSFFLQLSEFQSVTGVLIDREMSIKLKMFKLLGPQIYRYFFGLYVKFRYGV